MAATDVETVGAGADMAKLAAATALLVGGFVAFFMLSSQGALAQWAALLVCVGAAGGKALPTATAVADLSEVTHDPLLASMRGKLRKQEVITRTGQVGLRCIYSTESVKRPLDQMLGCALEPNLACHGYGSSVMVTASFGMAAAAEVVRQILRG